MLFQQRPPYFVLPQGRPPIAQAQQGDKVRVHYTGTLDDGTVFDSSLNGDPIEFEIGTGTIIPGFENAVVGMDVSEKSRVVIAPEDAYGPYHPERVVEMPRTTLPEDLDPRPGMMLKGETPQGPIHFRVLGVEADQVTLDANHPLAGKQLTFELELVEIVGG